MSDQAWTVDVQGRKYTVTVEHDWQSRRATIRVDGRMAVKPMTGDETEREVPLGPVRYVVRRMENDTFDLDIPPEAFLNQTANVASKTTRSGAGARQVPESSGIGKRIGLGIGAVVLLVVVVGLLRFGRQGFEYMRVPWKPYAAADGTFKAKFSADPQEEVDTRNINGDIWRITSLSSEFKQHFYAVQHVDLRMVITDANARAVMNRFFDGWVKAFTATVVSKEDTTLSRNPAINFTLAIPAGAGPEDEKLTVPATMRGVVVLRDKRLFLVWTLAAANNRFSSDLREFIEAFEVPPPTERKLIL